MARRPQDINATMAKLEARSAVTAEELQALQSYVDVLEARAEPTHHDHDHPTLDELPVEQ
jgi:hypothetical protein